ncbi:hypothetical protein HDU77_008106 [Chytriomyces hyalinus]|nr:hypothetical protein HDU77_008106 [Chytriomyces hyalinus]
MTTGSQRQDLPVVVNERHMAKYDYKATDETKMSFLKDDVIQVYQKASTGWWYGAIGPDQMGWFPSNYVVVVEEDESPSMNDDLYIRCETAEGQVYHVHRITGETFWDNPVATPKQEPSVLMSPASSQFATSFHSPSSYGRSYSLDNLDTGRSASSHPSLNYTGASQLPPNWTKIEGPEGQTIYFNNVTKEMQYTAPELVSADEYNPFMTESSVLREKDGVAPNWGKKSSPDGRSFFFNYVTDAVLWEEQMATDVDLETGVLLREIETLPPCDERLAELSQFVFPNPDSFWPKLTSDVVDAIVKLDSLSRAGEKKSLLSESTTLMEAVRMLLLATRVTPSPPPVRLLTKKYHNLIMASLAKVVKSATIASSVWPPPDAALVLSNRVVEAITVIREFILAAIAEGMNITQADMDLVNESIANATLAAVSEGVEERVKGVTNGEIAANLKSRQMDISMHIGETVEGLQKSAFSTSRSAVISSIRMIMSEVGDFMSAVEEDIPLDMLSSEIAEEVRMRKDSLYNAISSLQVAISTASNRFAPANAISEIVTAANWVKTASGELLIVSKFAIQEKEVMEEDAAFDSHSRVETSSIGSGSRKQSIDGSEPGTPSLSTLLNLPERRSSLMNPMRNQKIINGQFDIDLSSSDDVPPTKLRNIRGVTKPRPLDLITTGGLRRGSNEPHSGAPATAGTGISTGSGKSMQPWYLGHDYKPGDVVFNSDGVVKGGTLEALVERMTLNDMSDASFVQAFLLTYRSFTTTTDLFTLLQHRYLIIPPLDLAPEEVEDWLRNKRDFVRLRVFNVMKSWVENYCYDNDEDRFVLKLMKNFAETVMTEESPNTAFQLSNLVDRREEYGVHMRVRTQQYNTRDVPPPILPWNLKRLKFLDLDPLEIARQLTLMESSVFNRIQPVECLKKAWSEKESNLSPNVKAMIQHSNQIAGWVIHIILSERDVKKRAAIIKHFILVADRCRSLNNFCTLTTILGALNSASIHRLKKTWAYIGKKNEKLEALRDLMSLERNFSKYRETLHAVNPPCIPYFGLYLTDLTFIEDGSADFLRSNYDRPHMPEELRMQKPISVNDDELNHQNVVINFFKHIKSAEVIRDIQQFQNEPYHLAPVKEVQDFLRVGFSSDGMDDKELYALSLELEPRDKDNEKVAKMLVNSGFIEESDA